MVQNLTSLAWLRRPMSLAGGREPWVTAAIADASRRHMAAVPSHAACRSDVQCGHRVALRGIDDTQKGHSLVVGAAVGASG